MTKKLAQLNKDISGYFHDPLGFVFYIFPWGEKGTSLANHDGPDTWQTDILIEIKNGTISAQEALQIAVRSGHGVGKAQPYTVEMDTPTGKRTFGSLKVGDTVFGLDGKPTEVIGVFPQGIKKVYRVTMDDGTSTLACGEHLWQVRGRNSRRVSNNNFEVLSTDEIVKSGVKRKNGKGFARQWELPSTKPVEYEYKWVPLSPYAMGAWLGDGCRNTGRITNADREVFNKLWEDGYTFPEPRRYGRNKAATALLGGATWVLRALKVCDCYSYQKFIPDVYKYNTVEIRSEVLRGLLDTDGFVSSTGSIIYTSTSEQLIKDTAWLVRSLGGKAYQHKIKETTHRRAYNLTITMPDGFKCFYIERKQSRVRYKTQKRYHTRWIDSIELVGEEDCMCIKVAAEDSMYLTNDFIPTHNTSLIAWIILWFMSTRPHPQIVVTANTRTQLETKTWRELAKWHKLAVNAHWFEWTATKFYHVDHRETWFASAITWNKDKPEAFAGTHEQHVLIIYDEASNIPKDIWEVTEGAMTTSGAMWVVFGNPTRSSGRFYDCFHSHSHRWITREIDSRTAKMANQKKIAEWIEDYGFDSDFIRVRVLGKEPRCGSTQFLSTELIEEAMSRTLVLEAYDNAPIILSADVARFGDDANVIWKRQGLLAEIRNKVTGTNLMDIADEIIAEQDEVDPDATFVDEVGVGAGVVDRLKQLNRSVIGVNGSRKAKLKAKYSNKRTEMYVSLKEWLVSGGSLPKDDNLKKQLIAIEYGFDGHGRVQLERKRDLKSRLGMSPDEADGLVYSFADKIMAKERDKKRNYQNTGFTSWMAA